MSSEKPRDFHVHAPLPQGYDPYSYEDVKRYAQDVMDLLKRFFLIHTSHPDRFFEMAVHNRITRLPDPLEAELKQNPSSLTAAIAEINELCSGFEVEFAARGNRLCRYSQIGTESAADASQLPLTYEELPSLIQGGPKNDGPLKNFFNATERLKLARRHTDYPDPVGTLFCPSENKHSEHDNQVERNECGIEDAKCLDGEERQLVRTALLGKGMCTKKKHEVVMMSDTIRAMLRETRRATNNPSLTVMNVGEGKGYVSRVLSICEGTPVVGIDCNPLHKEVALERLEPLLEVNNANQSQRKQILNLNYCPRGRTTCVTCRVGSQTDWEAVLRGTVPLTNEKGEIIGDESGEKQPQSVDTLSVGLDNGVQSKAICNACGKIIRCQSGAPLVKHARQHADRVAARKKRELEKGVLDSSTSKDNVDVEESFAQLEDWVVALSPEQLAEKVRKELFKPFIDPSDANKRERTGTDESTVRRCEYSRATDLIVTECVEQQSKASNGEEKTECAQPYHAGGLPSGEVTRRITVVGYDDSTSRYKVFTHEGHANLKRRNGVVCGKNSMRSLHGEQVKSVSLVEPLPPIVHPISVPSLSSVLVMGLHTCGDLGASICRLYRETNAPSLVLVSCCWHALTPEGFPLSSFLRQDTKFATNSLSLMLATQPLDAFSNSSGDEHHGSSRLLFYRSMFSLLWEELRKRTCAIHKEGTCSDDNCLGLTDPYVFSKYRPVLDRSLLRSFARDKHTLSFVDFCRRVRDEAMGEEHLEKLAAAVVERREEKCAVEMKERIRYFLHGSGFVESAFLALAKECEEKYFNKFYASFVGFTTLRMWMSHLLEGLLLVDRLLFLCETASENERLTLLPLFDGVLSPRLFAILGLKT